MLPENVAKVDPLIKNFNLSQRSQCLTHIHGGLLDLVFDTSNSIAVSSLPLPCSDHFFFLNDAFSVHLFVHPSVSLTISPSVTYHILGTVHHVIIIFGTHV